jgi:GTP-binding protein HflX
VIQSQPDPALERGFIVAVLAQGVDPEEELAELQELARTALVEPIGELVQHRPRPERRTYLGKGKLDELKSAYKG